MTEVSKFVVGSTVNLAGSILNAAYTAIDRVQGATRYLLFGAKDAVQSANARARDFANNPSKYADRAENKVDEIADDVSETIDDAKEYVSEMADEALDETDYRPYEERTKSELYELACERDIDGRSTMSKDELIAALREERS